MSLNEQDDEVSGPRPGERGSGQDYMVVTVKLYREGVSGHAYADVCLTPIGLEQIEIWGLVEAGRKALDLARSEVQRKLKERAEGVPRNPAQVPDWNEKL